VRTPISYIRRGPFPSLACDSIRGASLTVHTQARPPGPALADAPEAHPLRRLGAPGPAVRDEEGDPAERWGDGGADRAGLVVAKADGPARGAFVQVVAVLRSRRRAARRTLPWVRDRHQARRARGGRSRRWRAGGVEVPSRTIGEVVTGADAARGPEKSVRISLVVVITCLLMTAPPHAVDATPARDLRAQ
jgi:hypothetical protein